MKKGFVCARRVPIANMGNVVQKFILKGFATERKLALGRLSRSKSYGADRHFTLGACIGFAASGGWLGALFLTWFSCLPSPLSLQNLQPSFYTHHPPHPQNTANMLIYNVSNAHRPHPLNERRKLVCAGWRGPSERKIDMGPGYPFQRRDDLGRLRPQGG